MSKQLSPILTGTTEHAIIKPVLDENGEEVGVVYYPPAVKVEQNGPMDLLRHAAAFQNLLEKDGEFLPADLILGETTKEIHMEEGCFDNPSVGHLMVDYPSYLPTKLSPAEESKLKDLMARIRRHIKRDKS